jgi:hypothetical protein
MLTLTLILLVAYTVHYSTLMKKATYSSGMSVASQWTEWHYITEEGNIHNYSSTEVKPSLKHCHEENLGSACLAS